MNIIGLNTEKSKELANELNVLLSNYQVFYMNTRGYHWNIKGKEFFELHVKFEELYTDLFTKVDEIAERVLTLGHTPLHTFNDYLKRANLVQAENISNGKKAIEGVLNAYSIIIPLQRKILSLASETEDEGTSALMSDYIREQEKLVWMYSSYLN